MGEKWRVCDDDEEPKQSKGGSGISAQECEGRCGVWVGFQVSRHWSQFPTMSARLRDPGHEVETWFATKLIGSRVRTVSDPGLFGRSQTAEVEVIQGSTSLLLQRAIRRTP